MKKTENTASLTSAKNTPISHGVGRRKTAVARVWVRRGTGKITVNGKAHTEYFDTDIARTRAAYPFAVCKESEGLDVDVNVNGGGNNAQADAACLGFSRALVALYDTVRPVLKEHGLLTVDSRKKERKKYGQKGARAKFQFVKR